LNLYDYSMKNNIEMGIYFDESDIKIYEDMKKEVYFIIKQSEQKIPIRTKNKIINKPIKYLYGKSVNTSKKERANSKWTDEEHNKFINEFQLFKNQGLEQKSIIEAIAKTHERSENAMRRRLQKFKYIK